MLPFFGVVRSFSQAVAKPRRVYKEKAVSTIENNDLDNSLEVQKRRKAYNEHCILLSRSNSDILFQ